MEMWEKIARAASVSQLLSSSTPSEARRGLTISGNRKCTSSPLLDKLLLPILVTLSAKGPFTLVSMVRQTARSSALNGLGESFPKALRRRLRNALSPKGSHMDEYARRSEALLAKQRTAIQSSHEAIKESLLLLAKYRRSVTHLGVQRNPGEKEGEWSRFA
jgi:hypothetical protein